MVDVDLDYNAPESMLTPAFKMSKPVSLSTLIVLRKFRGALNLKLKIRVRLGTQILYVPFTQVSSLVQIELSRRWPMGPFARGNSGKISDMEYPLFVVKICESEITNLPMSCGPKDTKRKGKYAVGCLCHFEYRALPMPVNAQKRMQVGKILFSLSYFVVSMDAYLNRGYLGQSIHLCMTIERGKEFECKLGMSA